MKIAFSFLFAFFLIGFWWQKKHLQTPGCLVLKNASVFDSANSTYLRNFSILIRDGKIQSLVPEPLIVPSECAVRDLSGRYLLPGLIDAHTHLLATDGVKLRGWKQALETAAARPDMTRLFQGEQNAVSMLKAGFTTVRDLGNSGNFLDAKLSERIGKQTASGPFIIYSGPGLALLPSQIDTKKNPSEYRIIGSQSDLSEIFKQYRGHGATWIKIYFDNSDKSQSLQPDLLKNAAIAAKQAGFKVAAHAEYAESISNALSAGVDSVEHFFEIPADFGSSSTRFAVVTDESLQTCLNRGFNSGCEQQIQKLKERLAWLKHNNFRIVFGSDAFVDFSSGFHSRGEASISSLISLTSLGLSPAEAIEAATATAADMLELPAGRLEAGKIADLVAFSKNPLTDVQTLKEPSLVVHNGTVICDGVMECSQ